jgi:superfamily II DNA/RNA helicase
LTTDNIKYLTTPVTFYHVYPNEKYTISIWAKTDDVSKIVKEFMHEPVTVSLAKNQTGKHIEQDVVKVADKGEKLSKLTEILSDDEFEKVIIFGETKFGVQRLADKLSSMDIPSAAIHGNKSQAQRTRALDSFKKGRTKVLVATDVAARGIDVAGVSHVINYDLPKE